MTTATTATSRDQNMRPAIYPDSFSLNFTVRRWCTIFDHGQR